VFVDLTEHTHIVEWSRLLENALAHDLGIDVIATGDTHCSAVDFDHERRARVTAQIAERKRFTVGALGIVPAGHLRVGEPDVVE
jgi:hypothetical protein